MKLRRKKGQSLVEFTLMLSILLIILMGILDLGRAYFTFLALQDLAGEGAVYASVYPHNVNSTNKANPDNIEYRIRNAAPAGTLLDPASLTINVTYPDANIGAGDRVRVDVTTDYRLLTPFIGTIVGSQNLPLSANATSIILTGG